MQCPYCGHPDSKVTDSRPSAAGGIRRRRECERCGQRFTTQEHLDLQPPAVAKRSGGQEPFDRDKLVRTLRRVVRSRNVSPGKLDDLSREVEVELARMTIKDRKVSSLRIAQLVLDKLAALDRLSWERFAASYRREDGSLLFEPERGSAQARQLALFGGAEPPEEPPTPAPAAPAKNRKAGGSK